MPYIVVDLDGTLADNTHREHFIKEGREGGKDWDAFHAAMGDDAVYHDTAILISAMAGLHVDIVYLTARDEKYGGTTKAWLAKTFVCTPERLIMRDRPHSEEKAADFKVRALASLTAEYGHKPLFCLEDQTGITSRLRDEGYVVYNVRNSHA